MPRDSGFQYPQGDVYSLRESVYTPIYDILRHTFTRLSSESDALKRAQQSFNEVTRIPNAIRGGRPAVIMEDDDDNTSGLMVCVATTFKGVDISTLPLKLNSIFCSPSGAQKCLSLSAPSSFVEKNLQLALWC